MRHNKDLSGLVSFQSSVNQLYPHEESKASSVAASRQSASNSYSQHRQGAHLHPKPNLQSAEVVNLQSMLPTQLTVSVTAPQSSAQSSLKASQQLPREQSISYSCTVNQASTSQSNKLASMESQNSAFREAKKPGHGCSKEVSARLSQASSPLNTDNSAKTKRKRKVRNLSIDLTTPGKETTQQQVQELQQVQDFSNMSIDLFDHEHAINQFQTPRDLHEAIGNDTDKDRSYLKIIQNPEISNIDKIESDFGPSAEEQCHMLDNMRKITLDDCSETNTPYGMIDINEENLSEDIAINNNLTNNRQKVYGQLQGDMVNLCFRINTPSNQVNREAGNLFQNDSCGRYRLDGSEITPE